MMEPFRRLDATAVPIGVPNIDTDQIIPARFLWRKRREGFGHLLFHDLRFNDGGALKPDFVLNQNVYRDARIVVADRNFGCGSSREHAVWALYDYGMRAVVAPSFGDIFFNNSFQNGLLPVVLPAERAAALRALLEQAPGSRLAIDLEAQTVSGPGGAIDRFEIDPFRKECLLAGTDDISFTLGHHDRIAEFENAYEAKVRWLGSGCSRSISGPIP
jgi:3-isopropylmalate/(R)-2-methylmalate dehydratase small subunit